MATAEVGISDVRTFRTRSGNTRFVLVDTEGREYSTFREEVAAPLAGLEGKRARIEYHEQQRGGFTNVYLDRVEPLDHVGEEEPQQTEEVAWELAVDAAPYLLSSKAVAEGVPPKRLFDKLRRFKELLARDLEGQRTEDDEN